MEQPIELSSFKRLSQLRFELDSRSIRFENPVTIAIRFDMRSIRARFEHSRKEWTCSIFFHYRIESNPSSNRIESSVTITIRARFELDSSSNRESCHNCDSIRYALDSSSTRELKIRYALDSSSIRAFENFPFSNRVAIVTGVSNRIELESSAYRIESQLWQDSRIESSSNRNCDRGFDSIRARFELDSIMEKIEHVHSFLECSNRARIERISNRIAIVTGFLNRIELESSAYRIESSSNRNCDRRFTIRYALDSSSIRAFENFPFSNRVAIVTGFSNRIELESGAYRARIVIVTDALLTSVTTVPSGALYDRTDDCMNVPLMYGSQVSRSPAGLPYPRSVSLSSWYGGSGLPSTPNYNTRDSLCRMGKFQLN